MSPLSRAALVCFVAGSVACSAPQTSAPPFGKGPVILFDIDTLRADHLGCYGYRRDTSPHIDSLAREGYRFEWAFSQAPKTSLSQGSIFTGLYPGSHGLIQDDEYLADSLTTLAESFSAAGYRTAAFVDGGYMQTKYGFDQGFDTYEVHHRKGLETIGPRVIDWLSAHEDETFFLLLHTYDVHFPYQAPEPFGSMFLDEVAQDLDVVRARAIFHRVEGADDEPLDAHDLAYSMALYDAGIRFTDDWIGRILEVVRRLGLDRRATIVVLSDHGEAFQEHGVRGHSRLHAPVTRIPLLIRPPGGTAARTVSDVVQSIDVMPTLLAGAGIEPPPGLQGRSLLPLLRGESMRPHPAFSEAPWLGQTAIAHGNHHLVVTSELDSVELFDLQEDPLERRNLFAARRQAAEELGELLERGRRTILRHDKPSIVRRPVDEKTAEDLRALGYIQ